MVLVADIDMLSRDFFRLREQGNVPEAGINFDFDNVTFVLNALDELAGDNRFIDIRKRRPAPPHAGADRGTDQGGPQESRRQPAKSSTSNTTSWKSRKTRRCRTRSPT